MNKEFTCFHWLWKELVTLCQILCTLRRNYFNRSWCDIQQILLSFPCPPSSKINTRALQYIILIFHSTFAFHISWCCLAISILSQTTLPNSPLHFKRLSNKQEEEWRKGCSWILSLTCLQGCHSLLLQGSFMSQIQVSQVPTWQNNINPWHV